MRRERRSEGANSKPGVVGEPSLRINVVELGAANSAAATPAALD
jgi:hypothetical protein